MKKISVIIPTYKPKDYIWECLDSLNNQTLDKSLFEIILVLNGCNEPWHSEIEAWQTEHPELQINLVQTDTPGVSNARNIALDVSNGIFIAFIDDDDYVSSSYLKELLGCSSVNCVGLSNGIFFNDKTHKFNTDCSYGRAFKRLNDLNSPSLFQSRVFFNGPVLKLIHRDIIGNRRFDCRFANGEDNLMMFNISDRVKSVKFTSPEAVYYRRVRVNSATTSKRNLFQKAKNSFKLMGQYLKYLSNNPSGYNLTFVASRFAAEIKSIFI